MDKRNPTQFAIGHALAARTRQRGIVAVFTAVAMLALLACAGLALDSGHMLLSKTRLQNTADAAALNAAKVMDQTGDLVQATAAVQRSIDLSAAMPGHTALRDAVDSGAIAVNTEFSNTLVPFAPGTVPPRFVRVTMSNFRLPTFLLRVRGLNWLTVAASAVSGPSPALTEQVCDIAPFILCEGNFPDPDNPEDNIHFGYEEEAVAVLKYGSNQENPIGDGNFNLARLPGSAGGADIRNAAAGGYEPPIGPDGLPDCLGTDDTIDTEPGNTVGPLVQGINTRFGSGGGGPDMSAFPPDAIPTYSENPRLAYDDQYGKVVKGPGNEIEVYNKQTHADSLDLFDDYSNAYKPLVDAGTCPGADNCYRRIITVPVASCDGEDNGQSTLDVVGFMCLFLVQPAVQKGNESEVFIQVVKECSSQGSFGMDPPANSSAPTKIILYKDPDNVDA